MNQITSSITRKRIPFFVKSGLGFSIRCNLRTMMDVPLNHALSPFGFTNMRYFKTITKAFIYNQYPSRVKSVIGTEITIGRAAPNTHIMIFVRPDGSIQFLDNGPFERLSFGKNGEYKKWIK